jgi:integrase
MLERGVHPGIASAALGHSSPAFTMSVYQHVLDGMGEVAAKAIGDAMTGTGTPSA